MFSFIIYKVRCDVIVVTMIIIAISVFLRHSLAGLLGSAVAHAILGLSYVDRVTVFVRCWEDQRWE